ncbi:hypothetical protein [Maritalea porphyrae]|uniref:hypothetical protein n=1 Tax=Maritalea porphyrae TaxID=880732 RepID=UPI0022AEB3AB|nr:hypothetical protein [Maritalea porphyrae]MCZ4274019.1 hypothetical protein [Maritalea porphyrae]
MSKSSKVELEDLQPALRFGDGTNHGDDPQSIFRMTQLTHAVVKDPSAFDQLTDWELDTQIRMLKRHDTEHDEIICAARARIFALHQEVERLSTIVKNHGREQRPLLSHKMQCALKERFEHEAECAAFAEERQEAQSLLLLIEWHGAYA